MTDKLQKHSDTISARIGQHLHDEEWPRPEVMPIYQTSVFTFTDVDDVVEYYEQKPPGRYLYSRNGNPNVTAVERAIADLEGAPAASASASGMGAISSAIIAICKTGDHVLMAREIYGGTLVLLRGVLARYGVTLSLVDATDLAAVQSALTDHTALVIAESISNPLLSVTDIAGLAEVTHQAGAKLLIDNTFATPLSIQPLALGADLVVHSATKYFGGHSDVSGGVVCGSQELIEGVRSVVATVGANLSPFDAWLIARSIKTLSLRFRRQCDTALQLAQWLEAEQLVREVFYPGLEQHPHYSLAKASLNSLFGAIISIRLRDDLATVNRFMRALPSIPFAPSLASVVTTLSHPWTTSHRGFTEEERLAFGITPGLIRLSIGTEHVEDLKNELGIALTACLEVDN